MFRVGSLRSTERLSTLKKNPEVGDHRYVGATVS